VPTDLDPERLALLQDGEGHGDRLVAALDEDDALLRREPVVVGVRGGEERRRVDVVVAAVGVLPVRALVAGLAGEDESGRRLAAELAPGDDQVGSSAQSDAAERLIGSAAG
jgi:hypothetical protein